jgi:chaperone required for assembly of F1-ATPase
MSEDKRDPMRAAQAAMRPTAPRRFYKRAEVVAVEGGGFALKLDGRSARTPGKRPLVAPTRAVAELIAAEWAAQGERIEPTSMPATRLANSAIDGVAGALAATRAEIAKYAASDLVCYRAEAPAALVALQAAAFDPALRWARDRLGAQFVTTVGVVHVAQPETALAAARAAVEAYSDPFAVGALHVMTSLTGSLLLALMTAEDALTPEAAWRAAHVDEEFQISRWGEDEEAGLRRAARWRDFEAAARALAASRG